MKANIQAFAANIAQAVQVVFVAPYLDYLIVLNANFQSA